MSEKPKPIYCGNGKIITTQNGTFRKVSINLSKIAANAQQYITKGNNGDEYINVVVNDLNEPDKYGKTVSVTVDTWKPSGDAQPAAQGYSRPQGRSTPPPAQEVTPQGDDDDLPF